MRRWWRWAVVMLGGLALSALPLLARVAQGAPCCPCPLPGCCPLCGAR